MFCLQNVNYKKIIKYPEIKIEEGLTTFICGESGSGKSTLLKLLNGVVSKTNGTIKYLKQDIENYDPIILRRNILLVGQSFYLFDASIKVNFDLFYNFRELNPISEAEMKKYLHICSIDFSINSLCSTMSGGERHRVFIAINLSFQPKVLMLDEPTSALDDKNANLLMDNITLYCKENKKTLIIVSHDIILADKYADKKIVLFARGGER